MLDLRKQNLLKNIIEQYYKTSEPVASGFICSNCKINLSSATIRNEMAELERLGYIVQPHTSAGRIPTEKGYRFYIDNFLNLQKFDNDFLANQIIDFSKRDNAKILAKEIAGQTGETVLIAFSKNDIYYTGISNLFSKPEFKDFEMIYNMSSVLEKLDDIIKDLYDEIDNSIKFFVGSQNPISENCSALATRFDNNILTIIGPMRMDYGFNYSVLMMLKRMMEMTVSKSKI